MLHFPESSMATRRLASRLPALGALGLLAGLAYGVVFASPASAFDTDWHGACQDKGAPQGSGQMPRYDNCVRQQACQAMADAAGRTIFEAGCFWVSPDATTTSRALRH